MPTPPNPNEIPTDIVKLARLCHDEPEQTLRIVRIQLEILTDIEKICLQQIDATPQNAETKQSPQKRSAKS